MEHLQPVLAGIQCSVLHCLHNNGSGGCTAPSVQIQLPDSGVQQACCTAFTEI